VIVDRAEEPVYLRIAEKAKYLRELGMSDRAIAEALGVSAKTVAKALTFVTLQNSSDERPRPSSSSQ
jgi:transcriptional regulator with XRE-family HTH domain